jgi:YaiO family outer membrane protein
MWIKKIVVVLIVGLGTFSLSAQKKSSDSLYNIAREWGQKKGNYRKALDFTKRANSISPKDVDIQEYLGKCYLELGQYDKARYVLRKAADARLQNYTALLYLLNVEYETKRYSSAICYVNEMLEQTPYERGLWIKKMNLYRDMGNEVEAMREMKRIHQIFPNDTEIQENYIYMLSQQGQEADGYDDTKKIYENIIEEDTANKEAYLMLIKNELENNGNPDTALSYTTRALQKMPEDPQLIRKKIGLLEETGNFNQALSFLEEKKNYLTVDEYNDLNLYLKNQAASFYENTDPYIINKKIYAQNPGNRQALNYILREAFAKGYYTDAEYYLDKGLERNPTSKDLLTKKLSLYKKIGDENKYNQTLEYLYTNYPEDVDLEYLYQLHKFESGKYYLQQGQLYEAKSVFLLLRTKPEWEILANEQLYNISMQQAKYEDAFTYANYLLEEFPESAEYQIQKSDLLIKTQQYKEALEITSNLTNTYPESEKYKDIYESQLSLYINILMQNEEYQEASNNLDVLLKQNPSKQLYLYSINAALVLEDKKKAISIAEEAHEAHPEDIDIALKLADAYLLDYKTDWTIKALEPMLEKYPHNQDLKQRIAIAYYEKGMYKKSIGQYQDAYRDFNSSVDYYPKDNRAVNELAIAYKKANENLRALTYINGKIREYPWLDNLKVAKGEIYENMKSFDSALYYQKFYKPGVDELEDWKKHIDYLINSSYKNQIDAYYSRFDSDSTAFVNRLAGIKYTKFKTNNAYGIGANYVGRADGAGVQLDLEWQHIFSPTVYGKANYYISNSYFPKHRLAVNVFKALENDYEVELGARFDKLQNGRELLTGILGLSKIYNQFWFNAKLSYITDFDVDYINFAVRSKYSIHHRNFVQFNASIGTAPWNERLAFQGDQFFDLVSTMVGAGYQYPLNKNLAFGVYGNWYNYRVRDKLYQNQYELTLLCEIRF